MDKLELNFALLQRNMTRFIQIFKMGEITQDTYEEFKTLTSDLDASFEYELKHGRMRNETVFLEAYNAFTKDFGEREKLLELMQSRIK